MDQDRRLQDAIAFHGHFCPGLLIGYRASLAALKALNVSRAEDEELVTIAETDACGLDAVQVLTGCTAGKGNLILRDWGKQVFTFGRRSDGRMVRVALRYGVTTPPDADDLSPVERRQKSLELLQTLPDDALFDIRWVDSPLPERARIFRTVRCSQCSEGVMEARARLRDGQPVCPECYGVPYTRHIAAP
ncbi:MAG: FmdE family protein [Anaerolineae bacterium]